MQSSGAQGQYARYAANCGQRRNQPVLHDARARQSEVVSIRPPPSSRRSQFGVEGAAQGVAAFGQFDERLTLVSGIAAALDAPRRLPTLGPPYNQMSFETASARWSKIFPQPLV